jgi:hypothetical protein
MAITTVLDPVGEPLWVNTGKLENIAKQMSPSTVSLDCVSSFGIAGRAAFIHWGERSMRPTKAVLAPSVGNAKISKLRRPASFKNRDWCLVICD